MSKLTITNLILSPMDSESVSRVNFSIPPSVQAFSFHVWYDVSRFPGRGYLQLQLRGPNGSHVPNDGQPYLYGDLRMHPSTLSQGYVAAIVPVKPAGALNVNGPWEARVDFRSVGASTLTPADCTVRLCQRAEEAVNYPVPHTYSVPVNIFYVGSRWRGAYAQLLCKAMEYVSQEVFQRAGLQIDVRAVQYLPGVTLTADLYSEATAEVVSSNAQHEAINVFVVESMPSPVVGAVGFAMLPGPQGFASPYTGVFVSVRDPASVDGDAVLLGRRIAHEMGHYLGLTHRSACLDAPCITEGTCTPAHCEAALELIPGKADTPLARKISGNLMFTARPGNLLNAAQQFQLLQAPIVKVSTPAAPPTPVTELKVKIKTGNKIYSWWRFDAAGTDDQVYFGIGRRGRLRLQQVSSFWDDFEANSDREYRLNPNGLNVEDIEMVTISKHYDLNAHLNLLGDDAWLLTGVRVTVNGKVIYENNEIDKWLLSTSTGDPNESEWSDYILPITR